MVLKRLYLLIVTNLFALKLVLWVIILKLYQIYLHAKNVQIFLAFVWAVNHKVVA